MKSVLPLLFTVAVLLVGTSALPKDVDAWVESGVEADPGGQPSNMKNGCGTEGLCSSDIFCPAMPEFNLEAKTKADCIWGKGGSHFSPEGSIAQKYMDTKKCEYSVYGNPCVWKETMAYCDSLKATALNCPWYCNKEELYCAARYKNTHYKWEDAIGKGTCKEELNVRYDAHCDPLDWKFTANAKKIIHCRAHAFSRSCNRYYDEALKQYLANPDRAGQHKTKCKAALKYHKCDPTSKPYLYTDAYCKLSCKTMSEDDGTKESVNTYGADSGCCDVFDALLKEKKAADDKAKAATDAAIKNGSCKDDDAGLASVWPGYTCAYGKDMYYCETYPEQRRYCKASCKLCGKKMELAQASAAALTPDQLEEASASMKLLAQRMREQKEAKPTLIEKYLREGYPDLPEMLPAKA